VIWLVAMRTSQAEARRFGTTAAAMRAEAASLERTIATVSAGVEANRVQLADQIMLLMTMGDAATDRLAAIGARPTGWLGPWISESNHTPDLLAEAGYRYVLDWAHDDQPTRLATRTGSLLSVPYSQEINDIPAVIARKQEAHGFATMLQDAVTQLLSECDRRPVVLGVALHPYIMGQPHRVPALAKMLQTLRDADDPRIWWTTAGAIADHVEQAGVAV